MRGVTHKKVWVVNRFDHGLLKQPYVNRTFADLQFYIHFKL